MLSQLGALFDPEGFIPHGYCYLWLPEVLWLHVIADAIITLSYFTIPFALAYFVKRRTDLPFKSAFVMFGLFIMLCGFTHVLGIVTIWTPIYWIEGVVKAVTAFVSLATAAVLWPLTSKALALVSPSALLVRSREIQTELRRDIMERQLAEKALFEEKERLRVTLSCIDDAVITTDIFGNVTYRNPVAETMTGWTSQEADGLPLPDVFHIVNSETNETVSNPVELVLQNKQTVGLPLNTLLIQRSGDTFPIEDSAAPIRDQHGEIMGAVLVFHDVTHAHTMAAEMTYQASHDALTGLINRREFERRLEHALQTAQQEDEQHTLLYLDLDQFKIVNDTCGHIAGDELLRQLTSVMHADLRSNDTLARLGGDEFGLLLENCASGTALRVAELLRQTVHEFRFVWQDRVFTVGASIGLVTFSDAKETLGDILRKADAACYLAKDKGRNRIQIYTADDTRLAQRHGEMGWVGRIQRALEEHRFVLYAQKILALEDSPDAGEHYEVLLRMLDEDGKLIPPMAFIPAAERYGLMPQIDRLVVATAFAQYRRRHPFG